MITSLSSVQNKTMQRGHRILTRGEHIQKGNLSAVRATNSGSELKGTLKLQSPIHPTFLGTIVSLPIWEAA